MKYLLFPFLIFSLQAAAQCKSYTMSDRGDTLNCIDKNDKKQGKWLIKTPALRGNIAKDEEGLFKDNLKTGTWRVYSAMGDLLGIENYRWGFKDGKQSYYTLQGLVREESWRARDPEKEYDTIDVPDLYEFGKYETKVIKLEGSTLRHGTWRYYDPASEVILRQEEYFMDELQKNGASQKTKPANTGTDSTQSTAKKVVPKEVTDYEKKNKKKKIKVRDGRTY
jgi:hypothetical protein